MKINFGAGRDKFEAKGRNFKEFICVDYSKTPEWKGYDSKKYLDLDWDLNRFPYPFKDNSADEIYCSHCIEHLKYPKKAIREMLRIAKPNARILIIFPLGHDLQPENNPGHISALSLSDLKDIPLKKKLFWWDYPYWKINPLGMSILIRPFVAIGNLFLNLSIYRFEKLSHGVILYR